MITTSTSSATKTTPSRLHTITAFILIFLSIQFLVGMVVNLFVTVPSAHPGAGASNYFLGVVQGVAWALVYSSPALLIHVVLGILLFLASLILIGLAIASRSRAWIITSLLGFIGIVGAGFNGASFMNYGGLAVSSLLMAIGFLLAAVSYTIGFQITR